ncbi:hypothetical protein C5Z26_06570 [Lactobacillus sp. CBA3606]|uniref:PTS glucose transporter subunit IIA n=1 Tax=Lactobacillus sp. CBA3606 TaxID=2099789 RepID=UPI000CFD60A9|nr:PTS glucose transporter subunit IIA [Lactobacillus sp. CBA3606]AVK63789.1 hypothetical protein C5Z26_06570 [Lactobacillus sp. CBA3606]
MMKLFQRKHQIKLVAPVNGMYVDLRQAGETKVQSGFAIEPMEGEIHAPLAGTVTQLTKQSITLSADFGCEYVVQLGQPVADLDDQLFDWHVAVGDQLSVNESLAMLDVNAIHAADASAIVSCGLSNQAADDVEVEKTGLVSQGDQLATLKVRG